MNVYVEDVSFICEHRPTWYGLPSAMILNKCSVAIPRKWWEGRQEQVGLFESLRGAAGV